MTALLVMLGAAAGAPLRYLLDRAVQSRAGPAFPWGTFTVNVIGSFVLGFLSHGLAVHQLPADLNTLIGTGFCGALTTYSTFGYETLRLLENRLRAYAILNVVAGVGAGLGSAFCGIAVASALWP